MLPILFENDKLNYVISDDKERLNILYAIGWNNNRTFKNWSTTGVTPIFPILSHSMFEQNVFALNGHQSHHAEFIDYLNNRTISTAIIEMKDWMATHNDELKPQIIVNKGIFKVMAGSVEKYNTLMQQIEKNGKEYPSVGSIAGITTYLDLNAKEEDNLILMINGDSTINLNNILATYIGN